METEKHGVTSVKLNTETFAFWKRYELLIAKRNKKRKTQYSGEKMKQNWT